jgi:hypothetical protein
MANSIETLKRLPRIVERYVPPELWRRRHHLVSLAQWLKHRGFANLARNAELHGRYRGQRAFVVANGPSLNRMNLLRLRDEHVFTVNTFFKFQSRWGIKPFCHTMIDPWYFETAPSELDELARVIAGDTMLFFPLAYERVVAPRIPNARYLALSGLPGDNRNTDLTRPVPMLQTVTLAAILIALYAGFSPVYLIGCDMDMMSHVVGVGPLRVAVHHFYDEAEPEISEKPDIDYAGFCHSMCTALSGFHFIRDTLEPHQQVLNAGIGGMLDMFPRVDYESLFG